MENHVRVSVLGTGESRVRVGGTPINAAFRGSDLAEELLHDLPPFVPGTTVRFEFHAEFFTFSWELRSQVVQRIARLGAGIEFCVNLARPDLDEFEPVKTEVDLTLWTDDRDPAEITARLGVEPTEAHRIGDPIPETARTFKRGSWRRGLETDEIPDLDAMAIDLCDQLPTTTALITRDYAGCFRFSLCVVYGVGGFSIAPETVARIAELGLPIGCWLWPDICAG